MPTAEPLAGAVYRRPVIFCVLPPDLGGLRDTLRAAVATDERDVRVVVERRTSDRGDRRRRAAGPLPEGRERRRGDRRAEEGEAATLDDLGLRVPLRVRRHLMRVRCVRRMLPVHRADLERETDRLLAAARAGRVGARKELRLRHHGEIHSRLEVAGVTRRRMEPTIDAVFATLYLAGSEERFARALDAAIDKVLAEGAPASGAAPADA